MFVDAALTTTDLHKVPDAARAIEAAGYDGIYTFEGQHDAMFPLLLAAEHTERVQLTTAVVIAFARNPMTLAQTAYDLQLASRGRFNLGLGTQIKPHIEKRFSMQWSQPVERMRPRPGNGKHDRRLSAPYRRSRWQQPIDDGLINSCWRWKGATIQPVGAGPIGLGDPIHRETARSGWQVKQLP